MKRVMIDVETLGTNPGCVILSIGAVQFGNECRGECFYAGISINDSLKHGLTIEQETLQWWMEQDEEARKAAFSGTLPLEQTLRRLKTWIGDEAQTWGNGAALDLGCLRAAFIKIGIRDPWAYGGERCYRTLRHLSPYPVVMELNDTPLPLIDAPAWYEDTKAVRHNALFDAALQAQRAITMLACFEDEGGL
jgi:DNA polymerase III epsilon subunit-like protein